MVRARFLRCLVAAIAGLATLSVVGAEPTAAGPQVRPSCGGERPNKPGGGRYTCVFEDDFTGTKVDTTKWVVQDTALSGVSATNDGCYVNDPRNVAVADGVINLTAYRTTEPFSCRSPYGAYESQFKVATVATWGKFAQTYGRFEFRAMMPQTRTAGVQSALWLYPQDHAYGGWPTSGEIDVAEWFGVLPDYVFPSVHYAGEDIMKSTGRECRISTASSEYHRYAVDWSPTVMRFYYDGNLCFAHDWTPNAPLSGSQPFDQPFYLVLTQILDQVWDATATGTPTSATIKVDWVRVWR